MPLVCHLELAGPALAVGAGETSRLVAKKFALNQRFRQCSRIDGDEATVLTGAEPVECLCDQFLAGAAFALDQHRDIERGDLPDLLAHGLNSDTLADDRLQYLVVTIVGPGIGLVGFDLLLKLVDPARHCLDLLWSLEHDAADGTDDLVVVADRVARHDAVATLHAMNLPNFRNARPQDIMQSRILDDIARFFSDTFAGLQPEELLMHRRHESQARFFVDDGHRVIRVREDVVDNVVGKIDIEDELQDSFARRLREEYHKALGYLGDKVTIGNIDKRDAAQTAGRCFVQPGAIRNNSPETPVGANPKRLQALACGVRDDQSYRTGLLFL